MKTQFKKFRTSFDKFNLEPNSQNLVSETDIATFDPLMTDRCDSLTGKCVPLRKNEPSSQISIINDTQSLMNKNSPIFKNSNNRSLSNPDIFGPGTWFTIHTMAFDADSKEKIDYFIDFIPYLLSKLPCKECRTHSLVYIGNEHPENYRYMVEEETKIPIGMFWWSFNFHNNVNERLNKKLLGWGEVYDMYTKENGVCSKNCSPARSNFSE